MDEKNQVYLILAEFYFLCALSKMFEENKKKPNSFQNMQFHVYVCTHYIYIYIHTHTHIPLGQIIQW